VFDEKGEPQTVRYHFVNAMLLNEVQRQAHRIEAQQREIETVHRDMEVRQRENAALAAEVRRTSGAARQIDALTARLEELERALGAGARAQLASQ
jgi:predicted RNase H-like nuclease (RuvC/YqgF family)